MAFSLSMWMASMTEASSSMVMGFGVIQPPTVSFLSAMSGPRGPTWRALCDGMVTRAIPAGKASACQPFPSPCELWLTVSRHATPKPGTLSALLDDLARKPPAEGGSGWAAALQPGQSVGRFTLVRELSREPFCVVFEAQDALLERRVALKVLRAGHVTRAGQAGAPRGRDHRRPGPPQPGRPLRRRPLRAGPVPGLRAARRGPALRPAHGPAAGAGGGGPHRPGGGPRAWRSPTRAAWPTTT